MMIAGLLFDVDGVLLDSYAAYRRIWNAWSAMRGLNQEWVWSLTHGRRPEDTVRDVAPELDPSTERLILNKLMEQEGNAAFPPVPGAADLLSSLDQNQWAIVTSGSRAPVHERFKLGGLTLPQVQIYGEDVEHSKPHPEGYLKAAERLGYEPSRCVVIEDAPNGVRAGKAAGCTVIAIAATHTVEELSEADLSFPDLQAATPSILGMISVI
ncbi:HAD-IA family hydrolase [Streptosporangium sp. NPDC000396]|uniref:HAD-IA family hydrolase n=1 Tax=Streptosporangium sp. NPDC000396 TaxID=3366185 RepID=UPI0036B653E4